MYTEKYLFKLLYREIKENKSNDYKFIGPLYLEELWGFDDLSNYNKMDLFMDKFLPIISYFKFSLKFNFPIIVDFLKVKEPFDSLKKLHFLIDTLDKNKMVNKE